MSKVTVISTSLRAGSNTDRLADSLILGAREAGHEVEKISLKGKRIAFCMGCLACQQRGECVIRDDAVGIARSVLGSDAVVFVTPIYYYEMSGQMKTLIDRMNSLYSSDYRFRRVYLLTAAAEDEPGTDSRAVSGLQGWVDCFEKAELAGTLFCGGLGGPNEAEGDKSALDAAFEFGRSIK